MNRSRKKWMNLLKKNVNKPKLYEKYKYNYLKEKTVSVAETRCFRGCNRLLTPNEAAGLEQACYHCIRDNSRNMLRCNGCSEMLSPGYPAGDEQLCGECKTVVTEQATQTEDKLKSSLAVVPPQTYIDKCTHTGTPLVFTIGEGKVFAGGSKSIDEWDCLDQIDFILRLTGEPAILCEWNREAENLFGLDWLQKLVVAIPTVGLLWQDMSAPPFGIGSVQRVVDVIKGGKNVLVHCVGGHGRTGTMLLAMAHVAGLVPEENKTKPIAWLRKLYCEKAVETESQRDWLRELGIQVEAEAIVPLIYQHFLSAGVKDYQWCNAHKTGFAHTCNMKV